MLCEIMPVSRTLKTNSLAPENKPTDQAHSMSLQAHKLSLEMRLIVTQEDKLTPLSDVRMGLWKSEGSDSFDVGDSYGYRL